MKNPVNPKERNLIKGALRRVFSRSDLRRQALARVYVPGHVDAERPRVTKWSICQECHQFIPQYLMQVDHTLPVIPLDKSLEDLAWDEVVDRMWCDLDNLTPLCKPCHKLKSSAETKLRKKYRKEKKANE